MCKLKKIKIILLIVAATLIGAMCLFSSNLKAELNIDSLRKARGYDAVGDFSEGMARVSKDDYWWFIDKEGKEYWKKRKYDYVWHFSKGMAGVKKDGYWFFIDKEGKEYWKKRKYDFVRPFSEGLASVKKYDKCGFIDTTGNVVINLQYNYAYDFKGGKAKVGTDKEGFYIDKTGKRIGKSPQ